MIWLLETVGTASLKSAANGIAASVYPFSFVTPFCLILAVFSDEAFQSSAREYVHDLSLSSMLVEVDRLGPLPIYLEEYFIVPAL